MHYNQKNLSLGNMFEPKSVLAQHLQLGVGLIN